MIPSKFYRHEPRDPRKAAFLEAASKDAEVSDDLIDQLGEACKESFRKQFTDQRNKEFGLRASNIGRPCVNYRWKRKV